MWCSGADFGHVETKMGDKGGLDKKTLFLYHCLFLVECCLHAHLHDM